MLLYVTVNILFDYTGGDVAKFLL